MGREDEMEGKEDGKMRGDRARKEARNDGMVRKVRRKRGDKERRASRGEMTRRKKRKRKGEGGK